jgi:putative transposase
VKLMCQVLKVTRSGYYAWRDRPVCRRQQRRVQIVERIRQVFDASRGSYGSPRTTADLNGRGVQVCENTVAKYMRESGIFVRPRRRFVPRTTDSDHAHPVAPNTLGRDFAAKAPDRKWACDVTYIFTAEGWLYLSVVMDLYSRRIVGWSMSNNLKASATIQALTMAIARRRPGKTLLHHSDRGVQYACHLYRQVLANHGIECSMSRAGNCFDNAVVESFSARSRANWSIASVTAPVPRPARVSLNGSNAGTTVAAGTRR